MKLFDLTDRVAVVTGALGRLGPVWSEALLESGALVCGVDLPQAPVSEGFAKLQAQYGEKKLRLHRADVCDKASLQKVLEAAGADGGEPSVLVNNAGLDQPPGNVKSYRLEDIPAELSRSILDVNVLGALNAMQVFGGAMAKKGRGSIVNIGSLYASVSPDARLYEHISTDPPFLKPPAYGASKAALAALSLYFAAHWGSRGVRVNTLSPGGVSGGQDSEFRKKFCAKVPLARMAEAADLKGPLVFLASDASSYITGANLNVDGGFTAW